MGQSDTFIKTTPVERAYAMAQAVIGARKDGRVGQIIGMPGTGKSEVGHWLADEFNGVRICAWARISDKALLQELARAFADKGLSIDPHCTSNTLMQRMRSLCAGKLIVVDEANHLTWQNLERLRFFPDECGAALILAGTDLLERTFLEKRNATYLAQLSRRIGAKRVRLQPFANVDEVTAYLINPRFGSVSAKTAKAFLRHSGGYWGIGQELADACTRLMEAEKIEKLTDTIVETAAEWMAKSGRTS